MKDPIQKSVDVPLSPADAFELFTTKMDTWWPLDQKGVALGKGLAPSTTIRVDGREGGQVVEIMANDEEAVWGEILEWSPGERFRMTWRPGKAADMPTEVSVTFVPLGNGCRVELTHSGFEAYETGATSRANYADGWEALMGTIYASAAGALATA